jgi:hypothetical protein
VRSRGLHALVLAGALALAGPLALAESAAAPAPAEIPRLDADQWSTRVAEALRVHAPLSARARVRVERPGEPTLEFTFDMLRQPWRSGTRTVFEMQEEGDPRSIVSELVVEPGEPMVNWYWDLQKRRWLAVKGLLATDPWADSDFRHEDLWLIDPSARRRGSVREVEEDGRRWVEVHSEPYHYYGRVETRIDPETSLPVRIRFIDVTGAPIREQLFESVQLVDGRPYPMVIRVRELMTGNESVLTWERLEFDRKIPPSFLDLSVLHDRITRGVDPVPLDALPDDPPAPDQT